MKNNFSFDFLVVIYFSARRKLEEWNEGIEMKSEEK